MVLMQLGHPRPHSVTRSSPTSSHRPYSRPRATLPTRRARAGATSSATAAAAATTLEQEQEEEELPFQPRGLRHLRPTLAIRPQREAMEESQVHLVERPLRCRLLRLVWDPPVSFPLPLLLVSRRGCARSLGGVVSVLAQARHAPTTPLCTHEIPMRSRSSADYVRYTLRQTGSHRR